MVCGGCGAALSPSTGSGRAQAQRGALDDGVVCGGWGSALTPSTGSGRGLTLSRREREPKTRGLVSLLWGVWRRLVRLLCLLRQAQEGPCFAMARKDGSWRFWMGRRAPLTPSTGSRRAQAQRRGWYLGLVLLRMARRPHPFDRLRAGPSLLPRGEGTEDAVCVVLLRRMAEAREIASPRFAMARKDRWAGRARLSPLCASVCRRESGWRRFGEILSGFLLT